MMNLLGNSRAASPPTPDPVAGNRFRRNISTTTIASTRRTSTQLADLEYCPLAASDRAMASRLSRTRPSVGAGSDGPGVTRKSVRRSWRWMGFSGTHAGDPQELDRHTHTASQSGIQHLRRNAYAGLLYSEMGCKIRTRALQLQRRGGQERCLRI